MAFPESVEDTQALLTAGDYVADRSLATALYLSLSLGRPLFLEGEAGVGKTETAKVLAQTLGRRLVRLQCYEGLDASSRRSMNGTIRAADGRNPARRSGGRYRRVNRAWRWAKLSSPERFLIERPAAAGSGTGYLG